LSEIRRKWGHMLYCCPEMATAPGFILEFAVTLLTLCHISSKQA